MDFNETNRKVAVIVPTFNEENYIADCLRSLQQQTVAPDEIIVVDNNSTDSTLEIVNSFSGVKVLREPCQGQLYARTRGFDSTKADIIATIDADCIALPHWVESLKAEFATKPIDAVSGFITSRDITILRSEFNHFFNFIEYSVNRLICGHHILFGSNMAMSRRFWQSSRHYLRPDTSLWEDYDLAVIGNSLGFAIGCLRNVGVDISLRRTRMSSSKLRSYYSGWYRTFWPYNRRAAIIAFVLSYVFAGGIVILRPYFIVRDRSRKLQADTKPVVT